MTIQNRLPLALSYDSNNTPSGLAEFQISSVDLADVATDHAPEQYQVLAWSAVGDGTFLYAPSTIVTGGGGGGGGSVTGVPAGVPGDIVTYASENTPQALSPTATPLNLATTGYVASELADYLPVAAAADVTGPITFVVNEPQFPVGFNATGPATHKGAFSFTDTLPTVNSQALATQQYVQDNAALVGSVNTFTQANSFQKGLNVTSVGLNVTGPTSFNATPTVNGTDVVVDTDLAAYVTETEYDASADLFTTTATFYTTTATLLEKPSTGSDGDLLLYSTGNDTATTSVANFITDQTLVKTSDLGAYVTETEYDTSADLFTTTGLFYTTTATLVTKDGFDGSAADFVTNAEYDTSADLFVATSITTANSRTFLGTDTKLSRISDVSFEAALATGDTLRYNEEDTQWRNYPAAANFLLLGNQTVTPNYATASGSYIVSNAVTVPPGFTGKGDTTVDSFIIFSGTDASSTEYVGTRWGANWVEGPQNIETTNGNYFAYVSATPTGDAPGLSGVAAVELNANALEFIENGSATNVSANSVTISDLNVTRVGQMNPTTYIQEGDWLTPAAAANGFGSSQTGTGAGFGQCFDNDVMHPDKGTFGVYEIRSGSDAYGRAFLTTFNNAIAVSSCAISFTSRIAPSGLWVAGSNDGKMSFGIRNGTSNAEPTYAMEFQYGQATGKGGNNWSAVVVDNSNSTVSDTGIAASGQEFQVLQVSCNENWQNVDFYVDGVLKASFNIADHNIPDSRYNRLGAAWSINNANIFSSSNQTVGNEIFLDWHQLRMTHNNTTRGRDLIQ